MSATETPVSVYKPVDLTPEGSRYVTAKIFAANRDDLVDSRRAKAREFAESVCRVNGFTPRGVANLPSTYPVNAEGKVTDGTPSGGEIVGYECEFRFSLS